MEGPCVPVGCNVSWITLRARRKKTVDYGLWISDQAVIASNISLTHIVQHPDAAGNFFHRQYEFVLGERKLDILYLAWEP